MRTYFQDLLTANYTAQASYIGLLPTLAQTLGTYNEASSGAVGESQSWAQGYEMMALSYVSAINDSPTWGNYTVGNQMSKFWKFVDSNFGAWSIPSYNYLQRDFALYGSSSQDWGVYLTATTNFGICGGAWNQSWTNGSATFTDTVYPSGYVENNGDTVRWFVSGGGDSGNNVPLALQGYGPYTGNYFTFYKVNVNNTAKTFQLASTLGGSPITMTDSNTDNACEGPYGMKSASGSISSSPLGTGYMQNETGALNWYSAAGGTVDATTLTDMQTNLSGNGGYEPNAVKYYFVPHFLVPANDVFGDYWEPKLLQRAHP